jgi:RNA ligase
MPHLYEILDADEYQRTLAARYIKVQQHPTLPLLIHNYTDAATWDEHWNDVTLTCRGLVTHAETGQVVARPFRKFFNHDQALAPRFEENEPVTVLAKADGSLGILVPTESGPIVATRGSFLSEQSAWATDLYREKYLGFQANPEWTYLFEIIYPSNRVVVDYGAFSDLILLGAVNIATGSTVPLDEARIGWDGPVVEVFSFANMREVLTAPEFANAEGFVVWHAERDERVKIKFPEYKRLHRLLTGINGRHVWEILAAGDDPVEVFAGAPDEFHGWLKEQIDSLSVAYHNLVAKANEAYLAVLSELPEEFDRRMFAEKVSSHEMKTHLFLLLDGRSVDEPIWKSLKPVNGGDSVRLVTSDAD